MLAIIAGTGELPTTLANELKGRSQPFIICGMQGHLPDLPCDMEFRLETLGTLLGQLSKRGVTQICLAGAIRRPKIDPSAIDAATQPIVPLLSAALSKGDDGALRAVIALFEDRGFEIVGAHEIAPDLLPPSGVLTQAEPIGRHEADARVGEKILAEMGDVDEGQSCIIAGGRVIAREGPDGTDAMLAPFARPSAKAEAEGILFPLDFAGSLVSSAADWLTGEGPPTEGGILFKGPKPNQDRRADLPVIGVETARRAAQSRLAGIVISAGGVMVLDLASVRGVLDQHGLFLWVRE